MWDQNKISLNVAHGFPEERNDMSSTSLLARNKTQGLLTYHVGVGLWGKNIRDSVDCESNIRHFVQVVAFHGILHKN